MAINVKDKLVTLESLGVAYSAEQDAREEADQALSTRIDNIVAPEGDPSLTEVSDARVSGSTTHNTLKARLDADKAAIETEISGINESLDDVKADLDNNINDLMSGLERNTNGLIEGSISIDVTWEDGGFYTSTGAKNIPASASYAYSNRTVNMFKGDGQTCTITMSGNGKPAIQIFEYDFSKTYVGLIRQIYGSGVTFTFEENKYYNIAFIDVNNVERPSLSNLSIEANMELNYIPSIIKDDYTNLLASKENTGTARNVREVAMYDILALCTLERGSLTAEGADVNHSYRIRTKGFINVEDVTTLNCIMQSGYVLYIYGFDSAKTFISILGEYLQNTRTVDVSSASYIRMMLMKTSGLLPFEDVSNYNIRASYVLRDRLNSLDYSVNIPSYWTTYLPNKINTINGKMDSCALSGDGFVFITDYHTENNRAMSHWLIKFITEHTSVKDVVFGGDILNGSTTHDNAYAKIKEVADRFSIIDRFYFLRGNHDYNLNDGGSVAEKITDSELYNLMMKRSEYLVSGNPGNLYYYRDNDKQHIRYIYLDSRYEDSTDPIDDDQLDWMKARITELDATWNVVVLTHELFGTDATSYNPSGTKIVAALNSVKQTAHATIPCVIAGHTHKDINKTDNGTVMIGVGCDTMQSFSGTDRQAGTTTEQLFDVFSIDTASRKIYAIRIGYGSDREFSY